MLACSSSADSMATVCKTHARAHARVQERQRVVYFLSGDLTVAQLTFQVVFLFNTPAVASSPITWMVDGPQRPEECVCVCVWLARPCQVEEAFSAVMDVGGAYCVACRKQPVHNWEHRNILEL